MPAKLSVITLTINLNACGTHKKSTDGKSFIEKLKAFASAQVKKEQSKQKPAPQKPIVNRIDRKQRNPFQLNQTGNGKTPNSNALLGQYSLRELKLVGVIIHPDKKWALIKAPDKKIYRILKGARLGRENAVVTKINHHDLILNISQGDRRHRVRLILEER
ncbi:MAG: pilus assembly protein PilP [Gammaproteobacteria bacterium]|nr:pilus assembly protein PilP [Gammaproteobacteria bacterium]